jgi:hypothetical protein
VLLIFVFGCVVNADTVSKHCSMFVMYLILISILMTIKLDSNSVNATDDGGVNGGGARGPEEANRMFSWHSLIPFLTTVSTNTLPQHSPLLYASPSNQTASAEGGLSATHRSSVTSSTFTPAGPGTARSTGECV